MAKVLLGTEVCEDRVANVWLAKGGLDKSGEEERMAKKKKKKEEGGEAKRGKGKERSRSRRRRRRREDRGKKVFSLSFEGIVTAATVLMMEEEGRLKKSPGGSRRVLRLKGEVYVCSPISEYVCR